MRIILVALSIMSGGIGWLVMAAEYKQALAEPDPNIYNDTCVVEFSEVGGTVQCGYIWDIPNALPDVDLHHTPQPFIKI